MLHGYISQLAMPDMAVKNSVGFVNLQFLESLHS